MKPCSLAVTGGIGSGKSSVCRLLAAYCGVPLIDIDACCHSLVERNKPGWQALYQLLGTSYFSQAGELDRKKLRTALFEDAGLRQSVDAALHPIVRGILLSELNNISANLVFVDIPLLYEVGWVEDFTAVIVVSVSTEIQFQRVMQRDKVTLEEAKASVNAQMSLSKKTALADFVVHNDVSWSETRRDVLALAEQLEQEYGAGARDHLQRKD